MSSQNDESVFYFYIEPRTQLISNLGAPRTDYIQIWATVILFYAVAQVLRHLLLNGTRLGNALLYSPFFSSCQSQAQSDMMRIKCGMVYR